MLRSKEIGAATNKDGDLQGYFGNPGRGERVYGVSRGVLTTPYQPVPPWCAVPLLNVNRLLRVAGASRLKLVETRAAPSCAPV